MSRVSTLQTIAQGMRYFGVGSKVTRTGFYKFGGHGKDTSCYWVITRADAKQHQKNIDLYGRLVWKGEDSGEETRITSTMKDEWMVVQFPDYHRFSAQPSEIEALLKDIPKRASA